MADLLRYVAVPLLPAEQSKLIREVLKGEPAGDRPEQEQHQSAWLVVPVPVRLRQECRRRVP